MEKKKSFESMSPVHANIWNNSEWESMWLSWLHMHFPCSGRYTSSRNVEKPVEKRERILLKRWEERRGEQRRKEKRRGPKRERERGICARRGISDLHGITSTTVTLRRCPTSISTICTISLHLWNICRIFGQVVLEAQRERETARDSNLCNNRQSG